MPILDKFSTTLFSSPPTAKPEEKSLRQPERLTLELNFTRISQPSNVTSQSHPHVLFSPVHYEPEYAYPLLVWLHGTGGDERQVMRIMPTVSMRNYVAVAPQGLAVSHHDKPAETVNKFDVSSILRNGTRTKELYDWQPNSDEELTEAETRIFDCIAIAQERCNIASDRIFLAGFGSGGTMALRLASLYPESSAGAASFGGTFPDNRRILLRWEAARSFPVFLAVGESSTEFSPESVCKVMELFHTAGVAVKVREYACGQELIPPMLQDLNRWMMEIVCP
jgi:phospholipase/carboxylesterase